MPTFLQYFLDHYKTTSYTEYTEQQMQGHGLHSTWKQFKHLFTLQSENIYLHTWNSREFSESFSHNTTCMDLTWSRELFPRHNTEFLKMATSQLTSYHSRAIIWRKQEYQIGSELYQSLSTSCTFEKLKVLEVWGLGIGPDLKYKFYWLQDNK